MSLLGIALGLSLSPGDALTLLLLIDENISSSSNAILLSPLPYSRLPFVAVSLSSASLKENPVNRSVFII